MIDRRQLHLMLAGMALLAHALLLGFGACRNSPARDEVAHLTAGLSHLELRKFDLYRVNPPLVRSIAAIPLSLSSAERDWSQYIAGYFDRPEFRVGSDFILNNGDQAFAYFTYGRLMCIPFSVLAGWICFRWSTQLFGLTSGLIAVVLWCFLPEAIANGQLLTPDSVATSLGLLFWYSAWHWQRQPSWRGSMGVGVLLGLAILAKTTWLAAYPILLIITLFWSRDRETSVSWKIRWSQVAVILVLSVYIINLGYLFEGTGTRLGDFPFISSTLSGEESRIVGNRFSHSRLGDVPILLPKNFVLGIDVQKYEFDERDYDSYLRGTWQKQGWWYYYLYGIAIKTPVGCIALLALAAVSFRARAASGAWRFVDYVSLLLPGLGVLVLVSSQTGFNHHLRYVLPAMPYLLIFASGAYASQSMSMHKKALVSLLVCWTCISCLFCFPHHQSYFNELVGGPFRGPDHLLNSNVDWGQDVHRVRDWLLEHPHAAPLRYAPNCSYDPRAVDAEADWVFSPESKDIDAARGWFAISVNHLRGVQRRYSAFFDREPIDFVGYSTHIFHVPTTPSPQDQHLGGISGLHRH